MTAMDTHKMAYSTLIGHRDVHSEVGEVIGSHHLISALHCSTHEFGGSAKCLKE